MAENKKSFLFYTNWGDTFDELSDDEAGKLVKHLFAYVNDEHPIAPDTVTRISFISIKNQLKRDLEKYEEKRGGNSKAGREGNLKRWHLDIYNIYTSTELTLEDAEDMAQGRKASQPDSNQSQTVANIAVTDTVTVTDTDTVSVIKSKFTPEQFLKWFNESRTKNLEKPSNINYLSRESEIHLEILTKQYTSSDFGRALHNICNDKWANETNNIMPKHFLNPEQFSKYLDMEVIPLISKKTKTMRGWRL